MSTSRKNRILLSCVPERWPPDAIAMIVPTSQQRSGSKAMLIMRDFRVPLCWFIEVCHGAKPI